MNTERLSPRVMVVSGIALAAACAWAATLLGVGGRISGADDDVLPVPTLPTLPATKAESMAAADSFSAITRRPLFAEDRRPHPFRLGGRPEASAVGALRLTGVLLSGSFGMATLSGDSNHSLRLRLNGEAQEGWQLLALEPRRATVLGPGGAQVLELAVFDGKGGQPPTELRDPRRPAGSADAGRVVVPPPASPGAAQAPQAPRDAARPAPTVPAPAPDAPVSEGPSEAQMRAIRERIRARREQLQQQQQRQSAPPPGGAANH